MKTIKNYIIYESYNKFVKNIKYCQFQFDCGSVNPDYIDVNQFLTDETLKLSDYWKYGPVIYLYSVKYKNPNGNSSHAGLDGFKDYEDDIMYKGPIFSEYEIEKYIKDKDIKDKIIERLRSYHENWNSYRHRGPFTDGLWIEYNDLTPEGQKRIKNLLSRFKMGHGNGNYWTNTDCNLKYD